MIIEPTSASSHLPFQESKGVAKSISYRPEIDGMRAISILLVIFHHLGWSFFSGGFIGVDIFFVISGFLITSIVHKEASSGQFSFLDFYKRRILRLAPAYYAVLVAVTCVSLIILMPAELLNYFDSVSYSTVFFANFYMWKEVGGYFKANADVIPLLHLWSLAVEEQFYIFWPITLLLLIKFCRKSIVLPLMLCGLIVSIAVSEYGVRHFISAAYYLMPTRIFEFLIGAILVFLPESKLGRFRRSMLGLLGLFCILYAAIKYHGDMFFPGLAGILPCFGAALIIFFCSSRIDMVGKLLAFQPLVHIGRISYPAYLWHWPIIAFINVFALSIDWKLGILIIIITLLLSQLTYSYIEKPIKRIKKLNSVRVICYGFLIPVVFFIALSIYAHNEKGWPQRFNDSLNQKSAAILALPDRLRGKCNEGSIENPQPPSQCILGVDNRPVDFLLIGDSHANADTGMLDVMAKNAGLRGYDITQGNTIFLPETRRFDTFDGLKVEQKSFLLRNNVLIKKIKENHYKAVILAGSFADHYNNSDFQATDNNTSSKEVFETKLDKAIDSIQKSGSVVIIIKGTPVLGKTKFDCGLSNERFGRSDNCDINLREHLEMFKGWDAVLGRLTKKYPNVVVVDPAKVTCNQEKCFSEIDGVPLYHDWGHLNQMGSELIGKKYILMYGNPLQFISHLKSE